MVSATGSPGYIINWLEIVGRKTSGIVTEIGRVIMFLVHTVRWTFSWPFYAKNVLKQMEQIGFNSIPVVLTTALSTGMVLALQSYTGFKRFGAETLIGTVVSLSMTRELGPVLTGLMVAGRAGASMAAELGTMRVTEQIDALSTLATNPMKYLVVPRFIASTLMGMSPWPVRKIMGSSLPFAAKAACNSKPFKPGIATSSTTEAT